MFVIYDMTKVTHFSDINLSVKRVITGVNVGTPNISSLSDV